MWILYFFIGLGIIGSFLPDTETNNNQINLESNDISKSNENYAEEMIILMDDVSEVVNKYTSTSRKVGEGTISPSQSIELYEIYKVQFQEIENKMNLLVPDKGFESIHQHNLNAINLFIEASDLVIKGVSEDDVSMIYEASDKIAEASTEISTATELINAKS